MPEALAAAGTKSAHTKIIASRAALLLNGVPLLAFAALSFYVLEGGGFTFSDSYDRPAPDLTIPVVALLAGINFTAQGIMLFRTYPALPISTVFRLAMCIGQTPLVVAASIWFIASQSPLGLLLGAAAAVPLVSILVNIVASIWLWRVLFKHTSVKRSGRAGHEWPIV